MGISATLCMSPCSSDFIFASGSRSEPGVWREVSEDFVSGASWTRSFLLIACTPRIVTASPGGLTSSGRSSGVPANSQILLRQRSHLRTVIVTAAVYRGFGSKLRPPCGRLTSPLNLPAPGRSQTLYVVFDLAEPCVFDKQSLGAFHCD